MSADGNRLVIGGRLGSYYKGHVKVYDYDEVTSTWFLSGQIDGLDYYDRFGSDVDISEDGNRIIVGAFTSDGQSANVLNAGEFKVYEFDGVNWNQLGTQFIGSAEDRLGESVAISGDGNRIAVSSPENDQNGSNSGKVVVYRYSDIDLDWVPEGIEIVGECKQDRFGEGGGAVALDRTGAHLAVGAQRVNYYAGMSRVYEIEPGVGDGTSGSINLCL